jgi:hypothetical protein
MARPQRTNVDYFPHPVHQGKKMSFIKKKYGSDGYAIWYQLLEQLGDADNHYLNLSDETELMLLSTELMTTETKLTEVITDLIRLKVFHKELWEKHSIVFCEKFINEIDDAYSKRKNKCISLQGLLSLLSIKLRKKPSNGGNNTPRKPQSKVEKSKEKNIYKEKFDLFWSNYPKRKGKKVGKSITLELFEKLPLSDLDRICVNAKNYGIDNEYPKDPERFIKNDFWKDWDSPQESDTSSSSEYNGIRTL